MKARNSFAVIGKICKSSKDEPKEYCFKKTKNPTNSCVCVSTFQYVRGSIGVCLVCLAHRLAVVVVVAIKEKKEKPPETNACRGNKRRDLQLASRWSTVHFSV